MLQNPSHYGVVVLSDDLHSSLDRILQNTGLLFELFDGVFDFTISLMVVHRTLLRYNLDISSERFYDTLPECDDCQLLIRLKDHTTDSHGLDVLFDLFDCVLIWAFFLHHVCKLHFALPFL